MKKSNLVAAYFHLETLLVKTGDRVHKGAAIGYVGSNPSASDPRHLHFQTQYIPRPGYRPVNPAPFLSETGFDATRDGPLYPVLPLPSSGFVVDGVIMDGRSPGVSSGHKDDNPSRPTHDGVDIMYPRHPKDTQKSGNDAGAKRWVMPQGVLAVAVGAGTVVEAKNSKTGYVVYLAVDHFAPAAAAPSIVRRAALAIGGIGAAAAGYAWWRRRKPRKPRTKTK